MNQTTTGWFVFVAALGMMAGLMGTEVAQLPQWHDALTTAFVGKALGHLSVVITAFIGGKLIPTSREIWTPQERAEKLR